ncbi:hypothetical protein SERLA73DRAFT_73914 [Serpula lacrymans var. lacrymans S7.3]|uniref:Retrotransposon gag domain-containing protein n=2 Tax=Serpula lacrymans var. lacrymans TaxID=341189 RepID=F8PXB1_SERL3|nr:uncharacterized protein SERLADRAFT_438547 [Serpula lacrymans var. lacrymans S7.9]EGN99386.1 hypothetical protein SERLA73DRAFT_73914 [Serpula lacrymans var. lacrymans S7.3]EGO24946.1 hypothetical protein SERLADRAFT_438547 [Serpula lacrymans var. lacrymans S7.9]
MDPLPTHSDAETEYYKDSSAASSLISELEELVLAVDNLAFEISQLCQYVALTRGRICSCLNLLLGIRSSIQRIVQKSSKLLKPSRINIYVIASFNPIPLERLFNRIRIYETDLIKFYQEIPFFFDLPLAPEQNNAFNPQDYLKTGVHVLVVTPFCRNAIQRIVACISQFCRLVFKIGHEILEGRDWEQEQRQIRNVCQLFREYQNYAKEVFNLAIRHPTDRFIVTEINTKRNFSYIPPVSLLIQGNILIERSPSPDEATSNLDSNFTTSSQVERDLEEEENIFGFTSTDWMFSEYQNPKPSIEPEAPPRQTLPLPPTCPPPPPPPIPPKPSSMSNPTQLHGKVTLAAEPFEFKGEKEQFIAWHQALQLYLTAYASYFPDEKMKLIYLLSKISNQGTSTVKAWKENVLTKALNTTTPVWPTLSAVLTDLAQVFGNPNKRSQAVNGIETYKQENKHCNKFFSHFMTLMDKADMMRPLNHILKKNLHSCICDFVIIQKDLPKMFAEWKTQAYAWEARREEFQ